MRRNSCDPGSGVGGAAQRRVVQTRGDVESEEEDERFVGRLNSW